MIGSDMRPVYRCPRRGATTAIALAACLLPALLPVRTASATWDATPAPRFSIASFERWFEPDDGEVIPFLVDARGDAGLGFAASRRAAQSALAAWSDIDASTVRLVDAGTTTDLARTCPGPSKILFGDPDGILPPPVPDPDVPGACRGTLALGIARASTFEKKGLGGASFSRTRCGFVVVADGWEACSNWTECNLAEAITHELGHVLGFDHSSASADEPDPLLRDAAMFFRAHFDGRCASVRADDEAGARFLYPDPTPLTIRTATPLPAGKVGEAYEFLLHAGGASGAIAWSRTRGSATGLDVSDDGRVTGIPERSGNLFLVARAADGSGSFHEKVLEITIAPGTPLPESPTPTPTPTPTGTNTNTPTSSPTPTPTSTSTSTSTPTPTATPACAGDCGGDGATTVDEIVVLVNLALGVGGETCVAGDLDGDGRITVDEIVTALDGALRGCSGAPGSPATRFVGAGAARRPRVGGRRR
jgi:hypothetical protein